MSTRSTIGIKRKDGTETSIYCHWDGYIEHNGVILQLAYSTADKVEELLGLGDLAMLSFYTTPDPMKGAHSFDEPQEDVCVAYHRDRGEEFRQSGGGNEFNYLFDEAEAVWYVSEEHYVKATQACELLSIDGFFRYEKRLLLDAILSADLPDWDYGKFATADNVKDICKQKALEARKDIIDREQKAMYSYYSFYCD